MKNSTYTVLYSNEKIEVVLSVYDYSDPKNLYMGPHLNIIISDGSNKVVLDSDTIPFYVEALLPFSMAPYREKLKIEKDKYYDQRGWMWQNGAGEKNTSEGHSATSKTDEV